MRGRSAADEYGQRTEMSDTATSDPSNGHIQHDKEAMSLWAREYESGWEPKV